MLLAYKILKNENQSVLTESRSVSQAWWYMLVIPALMRLMQEDCEFKTNLGYRMRPCLEKKKADGSHL
jgi:hypothetical protein